MPPPSQFNASSHARNQSTTGIPNGFGHARHKSDLKGLARSSTFAPSFIKTEELQRREGSGSDAVSSIDGENDFSGKKYVWLKDPHTAFVKGWIVDELEGGMLRVQCDDGSQREVEAESVDRVNPAKFDKADDMAELTHLNEASVVHNLHQRYQADLIYTYSGLFLVTINPYCSLPIYTNEYINMYRGRSREDSKPHIFAMADEAFRNLVEEGQNQSILVTGESGAGKTENTKKVIQYLAAVAFSESPMKNKIQQQSNLSAQILRANPILEAFGNAQTVRNNNSSRFGKFIRIEFTRTGTIAGAFIDWYLLEKSRVVRLNAQERNYHVFYQLLRGADKQMKQKFLLDSLDVEDFAYTKNGNDTISGVSDKDEWNSLIEAFNIMGFSPEDQEAILKTVAAVLHLGNITVMNESRGTDQARLASDARVEAEKFCKLLGIKVDQFLSGLLHPRVKAGREWVEKVQTPDQVRLSIDALAKGIYERGFGDLVTKINRQLDRTGMGLDDSHFIGVLDIAGFEIFEDNSFEQLCINYTNEKLQQFFNHHMFVLEQEEYAREQIEWKFIDFGHDLQPTIDLIELPNPIGIFSCLDEDSVMPKATDKSFTEKLHHLWDKKTPKYRASRLGQGFLLTHYAAEVEYSTEGWLEKNKDPLNDNITRLLAASTDKHVANLFIDCADADDDSGAIRSRVKKGLFRTVAQRHKEQLSNLMAQLNSTHPHFVRCIIPNHKKRPKQLNAPLVLDQLRCNGVLEGIRIARTGFPNRLPFAEFRSRYEILCKNMPKGYLEGQRAANIMLEKLDLEKSLFRVGLTKVFFRAGVLAELEEKREVLISEIICRFQSAARGFIQRRIAHKKLYRAEATRIIQRNLHVYLDLCDNPWWQLLTNMKPLLGATRTSGEVKKRDEMIQKLNEKVKEEAATRAKIEEERRNAHTEIQRIQQTLESERALALDKEEIFKRLQMREVELSEKLQEAIEDQEKLEDDLDALLDAKKKAEEQTEDIRTQLAQAVSLITQLEAEKKQLMERLEDLTERMSDMAKEKSQRSEQEKKLSADIQMLQSQLTLKERKADELEKKLLKVDQDLDIKLAKSQKDLQASKARESELTMDNKKVREQLSELTATSTSYEDLIRKKESELVLLRADKKKADTAQAAFDQEKKALMSDKDNVANRLREVQAEMVAMKTQKSQLEREADDAKKLLAAKLTEDSEAAQSRKMLEQQIKDLKDQLFDVEADLSRERQSRDDVQLLGEHKFQKLKEEFEILNEAKITIEKELYVQQDTLRRTMEGRAAAEKERNEARNEIRELRAAKLAAEEAKLQAEMAGERAATRAAKDREASLMRDIEARESRLKWYEDECTKLNQQIEELNTMILESGNFGLQVDQQKERLESELNTVKSRLMASENDNRALLNKIQQKGLELARAGSQASESQRNKVMILQREKARIEEQNTKLQKQLGEVQVLVTSLEKRNEKLQLTVEDLNHEVAAEHKKSRTAEASVSGFTTQLAEAKRKLEAEEQLRTQSQAMVKNLQANLAARDRELQDLREQRLQLLKIVHPEVVTQGDAPRQVDGQDENSANEKFDLVRKVQELQQDLRVQTAGRASAEKRLGELREEYEGLASQERPSLVLEDIPINQAPFQTPKHLRSNVNGNKSNPVTPNRKRGGSDDFDNLDSTRTDKTADVLSFNNRQDLKQEVEELQNQLQISQMQNQHLQNQLGRATPMSGMNGEDYDSPSIRRVQKLEKANTRLHTLLDDSARKVSQLERTVQKGDLSIKDVQTRSHEELYELINSQEEARRMLIHMNDDAVAELIDVKEHFDQVRHARAALEVELRDAKSDLEEMTRGRDQDISSRNQLLQEYADLQIRFDAESSKLAEVSSNISLYKTRADEYFNKLEQAEIAVLKASRAEQFAKAQAREAEDTCATIMAERQTMEANIEDLQHANQSLEERLEDLAADLEGAQQARKRLQHELEDYRSQREMDIEDRETSMEQTRRKYQAEFATLTKELDVAREERLSQQEEVKRLREELDEVRGRWDDEVLNSSTWSKEKARLESTLADLNAAKDEAVNAHNDAQGKIVSLLSQVRSLRNSVDDITTERDTLQREKRGLEARLEEAKNGFEGLVRGDSPSLSKAAGLDKQLLDLKEQLAQQEDVALAAVEKMRRAEGLAGELQKDMVRERESTVTLSKEKAALEKQLKEVQMRVVDLETKGYSSASQDVKFLHGRVQELEAALEAAHTSQSKNAREVRNVDRTVSSLQQTIERKEKSVLQLQDDVARGRDKIEKLLKTIDELQASDAEAQLEKRRAERELREEREVKLRLERELGAWKSLRMEKGVNDIQGRSLRRSGQWPRNGGTESLYDGEGWGDDNLNVEKKSRGVDRQMSLTKGFL